MSIHKRLFGKILYALANIILVVMDFFIKATGVVVSLVRNFARGFFVILSMGGCFWLMIFGFYCIALSCGVIDCIVFNVVSYFGK